MNLRRKLLVVAVASTLVPWLGWQSLRQVATSLRETQEHALLAQARTLAHALALLQVEAPTEAGSVAVIRSASPIRIDGYVDDWPPVRNADPANPALRITMAQDTSGLYLLAEVRDATRQRADPRDPALFTADYVELGLGLGQEQRRYRLASAGPGLFEATADNVGERLPDSLSGEWQEDGSGYRIELRLPNALLNGQIAWRAHDAAQRFATANDAPPWHTVIGPQPETDQLLQALATPGLRLRMFNRDAIELASSGDAVDAPAGRNDDADGGIHWQDRVLLWGAQNVSANARSTATRLDASDIWQALSGVPAATWIVVGDTQPRLRVAWPMPDRGVANAVLLLESTLPSDLRAARLALAWALANFVATLLGTSLLLAFGASLVRRIRRLQQAVGAGPRDQRSHDGVADLDSTDELGELARHHVRLSADVATWTEYLRSLTSRLSHELNTPLAIVKSSLDNLDQSLDVDAAREYLGRARDGADRLSAIVRAMSESNRIERAIASAESEDFDLAQLVAGCAAGYAALAVDRDIRIDVPSTPLRFHGAPELIAQALDKLFDNARSFTPVGGWIRFSLDVEARSSDEMPVTIRVANQGPSLPSEMQNRLFDTLVSVRERSSRNAGEVPHLGLGLYVVKLVAELHRGDAAARNLDDGSGVEFALNLRGMSRRRLTDSPAGD